MGLILVLSVVLTACSSSDEEDSDDDSTGAQTITMRLISERKVCNSDEELAKYLKDECGGKENSAKYLEMVEVKKVYDAVEAAFTKETKSKYKVNVDLVFYTEDEYFNLLETTIDRYATDKKNAELTERLVDKFIDDYRSLFPEITLSEEGLKKVFFEIFPQYEKYKDFSFEEEEEGADEDQYQQNKDTGIKELVYPEAGENQLDIIYISGMDMYDQYIENEWIIALDELLKTTGKTISKKVTGSLLNGVKVDGSTYAIPNNVQIGEYTYMLIDKEVFDNSTSETIKYDIQSVLDLQYFLEDVVAEYPDRIPVGSDFKGCMDQFVWYWNIDKDDFGYSIGANNEFSALGALYGDPATATRGKLALGFEPLFLNENYRELYLRLKDFEYNNYFTEEGDTRTDPVVSFVKGDYSIKAVRDVPLDEEKYGDSKVYLYTDENGKEYYAYVVKYPEVDEQSLYGNMFAISANSTRTQACIKVLTGINTDAKLRNILQYGVEGVNYEINEKTGVLSRIDHVVRNEDDSETNYGAVYQMKLERTGNCFIAHPEEGLPANYWDNAKKQNNDALINPLLGFDFNKELEEFDAELDEVLWGRMMNYSNQLIERMAECADISELTELINSFGKAMPNYKEENGKEYTFAQMNFEKLTNSAYDTGDPDGNPDTDSVDENGESPYTVYYNWMTTYGYVPAG